MIDTILETITGYLSKLSLSITQYCLLAVTALIGGLVAALELQGSRLHKAQIQLLQEHVKNVDQADQAAVDAAKGRFNVAYKAYLEAQK